MTSVKFLVQGSSSEPYSVIFSKKGNNITATCTCPAGSFGKHCKHRINILDGNPVGIISKNTEQINDVIAMLPGTDVETALNEMREVEKQFLHYQKELKGYKMKLARTLQD